MVSFRTLLLLLVSLASLSFATEVSFCQSISTEGYYNLTQDIVNATSTCITVNHNNTVIDLAGFTIHGNFAGNGVNIKDGTNNITVRNGQITGWNIGVYPSTSGLVYHNISIHNLTFYNFSGSAINTDKGGQNFSIFNNTFYNMSVSNVMFLQGLNFNVTGNILFNVSSNTAVEDSGNNSVFENNVLYDTNNTNAMYIVGGNNQTLRGNVFENSTTSGEGGAVDCDDGQFQNTTIANNRFRNLSSLAALIPCEFSTVTGNNITNTTNGIQAYASAYIDSNNISNTVVGINFSGAVQVNATNNRIFNNSFGISIAANTTNISNNLVFNNSQAGIFLDGRLGVITNNQIYSNTIYNHTQGRASGIFLQNINNLNHIYDNLVIENNTYGIYLNQSNLTNITGNTLTTNSNTGIYLNTANRNNVSSSTITGGQNGIYLTSSINNNLSGNVVTAVTSRGLAFLSSSQDNSAGSNTIHNASATYAIQLSSNNVSFVSNSIFNITTYSIFINGHNNTFIGNTFNNSWYGPILQSSDDNVFTSNTMANNDNDGIQIQGSDNNNISSNTIRGNFQIGINIISASTNNRIYSNSIINHTNGTASGIFLQSINVLNYIYDNLVIENNTYGIYLNRSNVTNVTGNTFYANSFSVYGSRAYANTLASNSIYNSTTYSMIVLIGDFNNMTSNTLTNATVGIYLNDSNHSNISHNTLTQMLRGEGHGIWLARSNGGFLWNNSISNATTCGFRATTSTGNNTFLSNTVYNVTCGFTLVGNGNNNLTSNTVYGNAQGFSFDGSAETDNLLLSNWAYNNSVFGFSFSSVSTGNNLSNNNATNNSQQYRVSDSSRLTFTGTNRALQTPASGSDLNITGNSNLTGNGYNFTTSHGTVFFTSAVNVTVKLMNLSDSSAAATGCSNFTGTCTLITPASNVVNITNNSGNAYIDLGVFYNTSSGASSSNIYLAKYNTTDAGWQQVGQTAIDTANATVRQPILEFSTFGIASFVASTTTAASSSTSTAEKELVFAYALLCPDNRLQVNATSKGDPVDEVTIRLLDPDTGTKIDDQTTGTDGVAYFVLPTSDTYALTQVGRKIGYQKAENMAFEASLCEEEAEIVSIEQTPIMPEPEELPENTLPTAEESEELQSPTEEPASAPSLPSSEEPPSPEQAPYPILFLVAFAFAIIVLGGIVYFLLIRKPK